MVVSTKRAAKFYLLKATITILGKLQISCTSRFETFPAPWYIRSKILTAAISSISCLQKSVLALSECLPPRAICISAWEVSRNHTLELTEFISHIGPHLAPSLWYPFSPGSSKPHIKNSSQVVKSSDRIRNAEDESLNLRRNKVGKRKSSVAPLASTSR